MSRWFRHYAGMMRDEKLVRVAVKAKQPVERVVWVWGAILESAAEINDAGRFEFDAGEAAYFLRCDEDELVRVVQCLDDLGRVSGGMVVRWGDRQFNSDSAKERQRRYRERHKAGGDVQELHNDMGPARDVTRPSRDGVVTAQETETETYQKEEPNGSSKKRGTRLPDDWQPDIEFALSIGLSLSQAELEAQKFREWWPAQPGQKGIKLDWDLTWRTWCRKAYADLQRRRPNSTAPPGRMTPTDANRILTEREHERQAQRDYEIAGIIRPSGGQSDRADSLIRGSINRAFD